MEKPRNEDGKFKRVLFVSRKRRYITENEYNIILLLRSKQDDLIMNKSKIYYCQNQNSCKVVSLTVIVEEKENPTYNCPSCGTLMKELAFVTAGRLGKRVRKRD